MNPITEAALAGAVIGLAINVLTLWVSYVLYVIDELETGEEPPQLDPWRVAAHAVAAALGGAYAGLALGILHAVLTR